MPREHGAWAAALASWACGWAVARQPAWEPLLLPVAAALMLNASGFLRAACRARGTDAAAFRGGLLRFLGVASLGGAAALGALHAAPLPWLAGLAAPGLIYAAILVADAEKAPAARLLGLVALAGMGPAAYGAARGVWGLEAALVWGALAAYFALAAALIVARLRGSSPALWSARLAAPAVAAGAFAAAVAGHAHPLLAAAFAGIALRAWLTRSGQAQPNPVAAGKLELAFTTVAVALIVAGLSLRC